MEVKKEGKQDGKEDFYLYIYDSIKKGIKLSQISSSLGLSKQALNYYLKALKQEKSIRRIGYGTWETTGDFTHKQVKKVKKINTVARFKYVGLVPDTIRGHAFVLSFRIKGSLRNWDRREELIRDKFPDLFHKKLRGGVSIVFKGRKVHLWDKSVVIYERESFVSEIASESKSLALFKMVSLLKSLEVVLRADFSYKGGYSFRVSREHYSLVKNALARQYKEDGTKLEVFNEHGLWMLIDNSFNLGEWEVLKNRENNAVETSEAVQRFWNEHKETNFEVSPKYILEVMNGIQSNQLVFDKNMASHLEVLDKIGKAVEELREEIKKLRGSDEKR